MEKLTIENYRELQPWIEAAGYEDCNANIVTMLMWQEPYPFYFEVYDHFALAYFKIKESGQIYWYMPFCEGSYRKEAIEAMLAYSREHGIPPRLSSVSRDWRDWLQDHYHGKILFHREWDGKDYIYDRRQQETLSGKKMQKRRNHYNAFLKQYGDRYEFHRLTPADFDDVLTFLKEWQDDHEDIFGIREEEAGIRFLMDHFEELGLEGGVITIDGKLEAFSIVSALTDHMLDIHVEKANRNIRGLYVAILKQYLETADPRYTLLNREDDMGLPALAKAKHDMHPIRIPLKYTARFEDWEIRPPREEEQTALRTLWLQSFADETPETADFYFTHLYDPADCRIITTKDTLIAMCMIPRWQMSIGGHVQTIRFLEGVAVAEGFRGCGYLHLLMRHLDQEFAQESMMLQAYDWDLYVPYGYAITHVGKRTVLSVPPKAADAGELIPAQAEDCTQLYTAFMQRFDGWRIRDVHYYTDFWLPYQKVCGAQSVQYVKDGQVLGYASVTEEAETVTISEIIYADASTLQEMLGLLAQEGKTLCVISDADAPIEGSHQDIPLLMMKHPPQMSEHRWISESI